MAKAKAKVAAPKVAKGKPAAASAESGSPFNAALAKVIDADPDDAAAWSVYADWLQGQGDPRGELAVVQENLRAQPKDKALLSAEKKLLKQHAAVLLGDWVKYMTREGKPDIPGVLTKPDLEPDYRDNSGELAPLRVQWRSGFLSQVFFGHPGYDWSPATKRDGGEGGDCDVPTVLGQILESPAGRFVTSLRLGMPNNGEDGEASYTHVLAKLVNHGSLGRLRSLYIGDIAQEESECSWVYIGDLSKLYPGLKQLRSLTLRGDGPGMKLGKIALPELRELTIITGGLPKASIAAICAAKWPKLEKLELWLGTSSYGADTKIKDLAPILDGKAFPRLKHLGLRNSELSDDIAAALPTAKIVKQLQSIDLSKGTMSDTGANALIASKAAFAHLRRIDLSDNFIGKSSAAAATITTAVRTRPQRPFDPEYRYPVLGE